MLTKFAQADDDCHLAGDTGIDGAKRSRRTVPELFGQRLQTRLNRIVKYDVKRFGVGSTQLSGGFKSVDVFDLQRGLCFYVCPRAGRVERSDKIADVS